MIRYFSRRLTSVVLALLGAVAAVWSAFIAWYAGREGSNIRVGDLFNSLTTVNSATMTSLFIPMGIAALLALIFIGSGWRWTLVLGGVIAIATPLLWGIRQAQTPSGLSASLVDAGPWLAAGSGALMLIGAALAPAIRHRRAAAPQTEAVPAVDRPRGKRRGQMADEDAYAAGYSDARQGQGADTRTRNLTGRDARRRGASPDPDDPRRDDDQMLGPDDPRR